MTTTDQSIPLDLCRSCGTSIIWCTTVNGKAMPVDAEPSPHGEFLLQDHPAGGVTATFVPSMKRAAMRAAGIEFRISHFASCPDRDDHRKARR